MVTFSGKPLDGFLVEVFTNPDYLLSKESGAKQGRPNQRRLAACRTAADGRFCFRGLSSGRYELRSSSADTRTGWNATQIYVIVDVKKGTTKELEIEMKLGI
ncbi:MAG: carboxypeptidase regulatory-like domain-containing protein [Acidobacteria bacterium]|nr:carboxypeptidase regulatory-like domain-containing protein [Acidobacteriota bacterium]